MKQKISSKDTSLKQIPSIYKKCIFESNSNILDFGCGKYPELTSEYLNNIDSTINVYGVDPYNRTKEQNANAIKPFVKNAADYIVCANVLNVIAEDECIIDLLLNMNKYSDAKTSIYIGIYPGNKSGVGSPTTKGYQRNQKPREYIEIISKVFDVIKVSGNIIECSKRIEINLEVA